MRNLLFIAVSFIVLCGATCQKSGIEISGKLTNLTGKLDGCGWVIQLDDNTRLEPVNLNQFGIALVDGQEVKFTYTVAKDMASICMVGPIVELKSLRLK